MLVHGPRTEARECEEGNTVQDEGSQQASQDHKPEPDYDEHLQEQDTLENLYMCQIQMGDETL